MTKKDLPAIKKGDQIILIKSNNGASNFEGHVLMVTTNRQRASRAQFNAKRADLPGSGNITIYYDGPGDEFVLATNEAILEQLATKKAGLEAEIKEVETEIEYRTKYSSEEEFVADKLDTLINTASTGGSKEDRVKLMAEILGELKSSNML